MSISIRRAKLLPGGSAEDDYDVMYGNKRIGRLYQRAGDELTWRWILSSTLANPPPSGRSNTRATALEALSAAYEVLKAEAKP